MPTTCNECRHFRPNPISHGAPRQCCRYPQAVNVTPDYCCGEFSTALILPPVRVPTVLPKPVPAPVVQEQPKPLPWVPAKPAAQPAKRGKR